MREISEEYKGRLKFMYHSEAIDEKDKEAIEWALNIINLFESGIGLEESKE